LRATGLGLKLRFLVALCILALGPAVALVVLSQEASSALAVQAGQQALRAAASANAAALKEQLAGMQASVQRLVQDPLIAQLSQASRPSTVSQAEALLRGASEAFPGAFTWVVVGAADQILASWPTTSAGHRLADLSGLHDPAALAAYVQTQRHAAPVQAGSVPPVGVAPDTAVPGSAWLATSAFLTPGDPEHSLLALALSSLEQMAQPVLSPLGGVGSALLVSHDGILLSAQGDPDLLEQIGRPLASAPLSQAVTTGGPAGFLVRYTDSSGRAFESVGVSCGPPALGWTCLVLSATAAVTPQLDGVLAPQNTPLVLLSLFVVVVLVGAGVAYPIVQPIRRATRQIVTTAEGIRILTKNIGGLAEDHVMLGQVVNNLVRGLLARGAGLTQAMSSVREQLVAVAHPLVRMAHHVTANQTNQEEAQWMRAQIVEAWEALHQADSLAFGISAGWRQDSQQAQLGLIEEGVEDMSQTFLASQERVLQASKGMENLGEIAVDLARGRGSKKLYRFR
jgi:hypothetical protein